jgi:GNAT superfamily N-acetyltransferase
LINISTIGKLKLTDFYTKFACTSPLTHDDGKWITNIDATITTYTEDDKKQLAGKATFYFVDVDSSIENGQSTFWLFDEHATTFDIYSELYIEDSSEFKDEISEALDDELWSSNLFIVDRIEILPDFRGQGLANLVINEAIRLFAGDSQLCALKAFPLQFEGSLDQEKLEHDEWITGMKFDGFCGCETSAMLKLTQFYQTIGFFSFSENKNYMIRKIE